MQSLFHHLLLSPLPPLPSSPPRYITTLIEDVVFFTIHKENASGHLPDPISEEGNPDRDRQKLLREQNVLKEVSSAVRV